MEFTRYHPALLLFGIILVLFTRESTQEIPPGMWLQMKNISTPEEFIKHFLKKKLPNIEIPLIGRPPIEGVAGRPEEIPGESIIWTQEGSLIPGGSEQISSMLTVQEDRCEVKLVSVPIPKNPDPNVIYWPSCVKLDQCSGCCNNEILKCVPTSVQGVEMQVMRARYPYSGADYFEYEGIHPVVFDRHVACECRCRTQVEDCNLSIHEYDPNSCTCRCFNEYVATSCVRPKIWNNDICRCVCPSYGRECYDDEAYDELTCSCARIHGIGHGVGANLPGHIVPAAGTPCDDLNVECRFGYTEQIVNGVCQCTLSLHVMEGSLIGINSPATRRPQVPLPPIDTEPDDVIRVPDHPQFEQVHQEPTRRPRRPRPTRRPRGGRPRNAFRN